MSVASSHHSPGLYRASMFDIAMRIAKLLPLSFLRAAAALVGAIYALTHSKRVDVVHRNLHLLDATIPRKTARRVYREFGKTLADYFHIGTRPPDEAIKIISNIEGHDHLDQIKDLGKGALIVTGHLGLFELGGLLMAQSGFSSAALTLPEPSSSLSEWRAGFRKAWKVETVEIGTDSFAFLKIGALLRAGTFVATLIDRPHPTENTPVQFPNGTAFFSSGILLLAAHCEVPVVPATMVRQNDGTYHARVYPPIFIQQRETRAETLRHYSQQIADIFLPTLLAHPEQWYQFIPLTAPR